jgi:putative ABC transport system permease protein
VVANARPGARARRGRGLVWPSIRWRLGSSVVFFVVAVAAVTAATTGPIYLAAADQSVTLATLRLAAPYTLGLSLLTPPGVVDSSPDSLERAAASVPGGSGLARSDRYGPMIVTVDVAANFANPRSGLSVGVDIDSRTGVCGELHLVAGHCPAGAGQVLLSGRSATGIEAHLGSRLTPFSLKGTKGRPLVVVGLYQPPSLNAPFWWGQNFFPFGTPEGRYYAIDDAFVTQAGAAREAAVLPTSVLGQLPLRVSSVKATQIPSIMNSLASYEASLPAAGLVGSSHLGGVLQAVELQEHQMRTIVAAVALELVLLVLLVLYQVAASNSAARSNDLEVAELRGLRRRSIALLALREPALLLALATPAGLVLGWLLVAILGSHTLEPGSGATVDALALVVAVATFVAGFLAAAFGSRNLLRPALATESRVAADRRRLRNAALLDLLALVVAAVAVVELVATRSAAAGGAPLDPLASLTPGVLALAVGIVGARLLPAGARPAARATRFSPRVATALASRSIMRRRGVARRALVLVIALGVLTFSVAGYVLAAANRRTQADFQTGAPYVLDVHVRPGVDFVQAVDTADPSGHEAMAVAKISASSPTLAVDSTRLAAIGSWPAGTTTTPESVRSIASYLRPPTAPAVMLDHAGAIRLTVRLGTRVTPDPQLVLTVFDEENYQQGTLNLGAPLHPGVNEVETDLDGACSLVCRLDSISFVWSPTGIGGPSSIVAPLVLSDVEIRKAAGWVPFDAGLAKPGAWAQIDTGDTGDVSSTVTVSTSHSRLLAIFDVNASASAPEIGPDDLPPTIPSVVTTALAELNGDPDNPGVFPAAGLDGAEFSAAARTEAWALPGIGGNAALIDLSFAERAMQGSPGDVAFQVWCHDPPSPALLDRLSAAGVTVTGRQTAASTLHQLDQTAPALGFDLFVLAAVGATLLAIGALVFSVASDSRQRSVEFAALAAAGVPLRALRRSLFVEQFVIVGVAVLLGLGAGLLSGELSLGLLPEFPAGRAGPVLPTSVAVGAPAAVVAAAIALALLLLAGVLASLITMRRVKPENVRLTP